MRSLTFLQHVSSAMTVKTAGFFRFSSKESRKFNVPGWLALFLLVSSALTGCGSGGYVGGGLGALSASKFTIDAGQTFSVATAVSGGLPVSWTLSGPACSGTACGTLAQTTGATAVYTAPPGLTGQITATLTAAIAGTQESETVAITVNPDPVVSSILPAGTVGTPYTATVTVAGGTAPLQMSAVGEAMPAGLSFNAATGVISGTPTATGTSAFVVQATDSSNVPYVASGAREHHHYDGCSGPQLERSSRFRHGWNGLHRVADRLRRSYAFTASACSPAHFLLVLHSLLRLASSREHRLQAAAPSSPRRSRMRMG